MAFDPAALPAEVLAFLAERHLATLTTLGPAGRPHVVAVGFTFDPADGVARVITDAASQTQTGATQRGSRAALASSGIGRSSVMRVRAPGAMALTVTP